MTAHSPAAANEPPATIEGWSILHELWRLDWTLWRHLEPADREAIAGEALAWLAQAVAEKGAVATYAVLGQKADLMLLFYRPDLPGLLAAQTAFRRTRLHEYLRPASSFVSMLEVSLYEATAITAAKLAERGLSPGTPAWDEAYAAEFARHRAALDERLWRGIPPGEHVCFYPMSKRRGEVHNWYALGVDERRALMRGHGRLGHKYQGRVVQVIGGAIGLDDWEWSVDLHADDPLVFKKLVTEMRFDPASSRYAEFGPFYLGRRLDEAALRAFLLG
jgi:chlorite dismutase